MCGIAGVLTNGELNPELLVEMGRRIFHRGPDDGGIWYDPEAGIGLSHRRLSVIDLSPHGHQPMVSKSGRYVLIYNGEIYNFQEIRSRLEAAGHREWQGHSDTEVLLSAIEAWGLDGALRRTVGMFALALWDKDKRTLQLARDRFGEKPLYFGWASGDFVFGSELKALRSHPRFDNPISRKAIALLTARNYIPAPLSIYEKTYKLDPGCILTLRGGSGAPLSRPLRPGDRAGGISLDRYWSYQAVVAEGLRDPITDPLEAQHSVEQALATSIRGQAVADVPVGAFLSGGIDSSLVVALYQQHSSRAIRTFSIGFNEASFNEATYAKEVARHFGTQHHEQYVTAAEAMSVIPELPFMYDEPFADSSQIPTHLVSRFARGQVTVALSGDGGDELFGGYNRYFLAAALWCRMMRVPRPVRTLVGRLFSQVSPRTWTNLTSALGGGRRPEHFGMKVHKAFLSMRTAADLSGVYDTFLDEWAAEGNPVLGSGSALSGYGFDLDAGADAPDAVRMMLCDATSYLPDDILCKVDRAAMATSLETRVPFLDHRVAEVAARVPVAMKISGGQGKHILRKILHKHAPQSLFERPKTGFGIPLADWLRGPLLPWAEGLLDRAKLDADGYFDTVRVQERWEQHKTRRVDHSGALWSILMFQAWFEAQRTSELADAQVNCKRVA